MIRPDAIAVITYPGHCMSTLLTIKNYITVTRNTSTPIYVIVDDLSKEWIEWPGQYNADVEDFYCQNLAIPLNFVYTSTLDIPVLSDGWHRQQLVKLNLDKILPGDLWYVTDGDVMLHTELQYGCTPINFTKDKNNEATIMFDNYVKHMLQLRNVDIIAMDDVDPINEPLQLRKAHTHHAPFRWIERSDLEDLKMYVSKLHNNDFNILHHNLFARGNDTLRMTEWDLIEIFKSVVLDEMLVLQYWPVTATLTNTNYGFNTHYGTDKMVDNQYLLQYNIRVAKGLYQKILHTSWA